VDGVLREQLSQDQLRLLQVIFEPFDQDRGWRVWQYVDLTVEARFGLDAAAVLDSLPAVGYHSPMSMSYGLTWREDSHLQPQPGTHVALTVAGLRYLRPATEPLLGAFLVTVRHMVDAQSKLMPDPRQVVEATVSSASVMEELRTWSIKGVSGPPVEAMLRKVRRLLGHEPYLYNVVDQPKADIEDWTARVPAILSSYRGIGSVDDYLDRLITLVAPPEPPPAPPSSRPLDIPYAVGYLDAVWKSRTNSHLFVNLDSASIARLTLACESEEEFNSFMSALADVLGQVVKPGTAGVPQGAALEQVRDWLVPQLDTDAGDRVATAFGTLIRLRHIRVGTQHADARHKAVNAFREIGLPFPPSSWDHAWTHVAVMARGALDALREEVNAGLRQPQQSRSDSLT
jgi:hypothetical protein